jgi:NAD(P)H-hydrate epimerase
MDPGFREFVEQGVIAPERMRAVDANARALGVGTLQLMESAGRALADLVRSRHPGMVVILCGKGNNGGDGMVAARHLQDRETAVWYVDEPGMSAECAHQLAILRHCRVMLHPVRCREDLVHLEGDLSRAEVVVDALLGTGSAGPLRDPLRSMVAEACRAPGEKIAADAPTPGLVPDLVLSFHRPKVPGALVADIGIPWEAECTVGPGDLLMLRQKDPDAHKGAGGEVLVVGGGPYQGAPYLAGLAALRAGADLVRIASPVFEPVPDLIYERLDGPRITEDHLDRLIGLAEGADAVVMGNGLGDQSHGVMRALAPHCRRLVCDADALRLPLPRGKETIYTPHAGEYSRMTGNPPPGDLIAKGRAVRDAAAGTGTILLKGRVDVISDGARVRFNRTGCPAMTVGGTGDILAGMAGALFCHLPAFEAACIAAYVNGKAGMDVERSAGGGMLPTDLLEHIPLQLFRRSENG